MIEEGSAHGRYQLCEELGEDRSEIGGEALVPLHAVAGDVDAPFVDHPAHRFEVPVEPVLDHLHPELGQVLFFDELRTRASGVVDGQVHPPHVEAVEPVGPALNLGFAAEVDNACKIEPGQVCHHRFVKGVGSKQQT